MDKTEQQQKDGWIVNQLWALTSILSKRLTTELIDAFCRNLRSYDYDVLYDAFNEVVRDEKFFPTPSIVLEFCRKHQRKKAERFVQLPEPEPTEKEKMRSSLMGKFSSYIIKRRMKFETDEDYMKAFDEWMKEQKEIE